MQRSGIGMKHVLSAHMRPLVLLALPLWLVACGPDSSTRPEAKVPGSKIKKMIMGDSIAELQSAMNRGEISAESLTRYLLDQIEVHNEELRAVIRINPEALDVARALDVERASGNIRGPLQGIPILIKDNIETREMPTTAGSLALKDNYTGRDATVVARLRAAGAIILGKTNLSEWANFRSERSSSGWSAIGGQTRNPHDKSRSPCGSSSGSGSAVAAGLVVAALGTETDGSVVCPATVNGVVGIKPTVGLVSRTGIVPISHTQDTAGPMTRNVSDAALLLSIMAGSDPTDAATQTDHTEPEPGYSSALDEKALQGKRLGVLRSSAGFHEGVDAVLEEAIKTLKQSGAIIVDDLKLEPYEKFFDDSYEVLLFEFKHNLNTYLAGLPNELNTLTLEKLIQFNNEHSDDEMPYFQQEIFEKSQSKESLTEEKYTSALSRIRKAARTDGLDKLLREHQLDALIAPTGGAAWTIDLINGDHGAGGFSSYPAVAGYPHVTVPAGKVHDLPIGLSFTGPAFSEAELIGMAFAFEQAARGHEN